jgi:uncharacterized membrane protein (DUF2068 family)
MKESVRPQFLTILCILTFIGSGWGIVNSISTYKNAEVAVGMGSEVLESVMDNIEDQVNSPEEADMLERMMGSVTEGLTVVNVKNLGIANGIASILTLIGAILMWGLDKKGFWLYLVGITAAIIAPLMIYEGIMGMATSGWAAFTGILFSILYYLNVKHLN